MPGPAQPTATDGTDETQRPKSRLRRRLIALGFVLFAMAWAIAITYSVTAGGKSPERLDDVSAQAVDTACHDAQRSLEALPQVGNKATYAENADRIGHEDVILDTMLDRIGALHPDASAPATALKGWLSDWRKLVTAREHYVVDLRTRGPDARFVEPATSGVEPIVNKMNNWILEQGTRTDNCNTGVLQAEVVQGPRDYGPESKT